MIWFLIFLLMPSGGIGDHPVLKSAGNVPITVPPYVFENDIATINCSQNITSTASAYLRLVVWTYGNTIRVVETYNHAPPHIYNKEFKVVPGSSINAMEVKVKAKCKHSDCYRCFLETYFHNTSGNCQLRVLKKITKPKLRLANCWQRHNASCYTCQRKAIDISCEAKVSFPKDARISFEWYYRSNSANSWTRIRDNISSPRESERSVPFVVERRRSCSPLKEKTSVLSVHLSTWTDPVVIKCEVDFNVGNLHQNTSAVTTLCIKDQAYVKTPRAVYENETVTLSCSHTFAKNPDATIMIYDGNKTTSDNVSMTAGVGRFPGATGGKLEYRGFKVIQEKNPNQLHVKSIARCVLSSWYYCQYRTYFGPTIYFVTQPVKLEVIKKPILKALFVEDDVCSFYWITFKPLCQICQTAVVRDEKSTNLWCIADFPMPKGGHYWFEWYLKNKTKSRDFNADQWKKLTIEAHLEGVPKTPYGFVSHTCAPIKQVWARLELPFPKYDNITVACVVKFLYRGLSYTAQRNVDICILDESPVPKLDAAAPPSVKRNTIIIGVLIGVFVVCLGLSVFVYKRRQTAEKNKDNGNAGDAQDSRDNNFEMAREVTASTRSFSSAKRL